MFSLSSPQAFVQMLVEEKHYVMDCHLRPQVSQLPLCSANFTIYSRLEDMDEDKAYFLLRTGLQDK